MTNVSSVTTGFFPTAKEGFTTTLAVTAASGDTTLKLNSVAGYTNGDYVVLVVDPLDADKKQACTGVVDTTGVQLTGVKWTEGTNQSHLVGATVVDYETATHWALYNKGLSVAHNQDGTLKNNAVTTTVITDSAVTTAKIADSNVTTAKIADDAVTGDKIASYYVRRQDNTTDSVLNSAAIQTGFGAIAGAAANSVTETVTFPVAYATAPIVMVGSLGEGNPASGINAMSSASGSYPQVNGVTATGFTVRILSRDSTNLNSGVIYGYSWVAIGN